MHQLPMLDLSQHMILCTMMCKKIKTAEEMVTRADQEHFQKSQFFGYCIHQLFAISGVRRSTSHEKTPVLLPYFAKSKLLETNLIN